MEKILCDICKTEIEIPDGYKNPFIQCPDCGTLNKYEVKAAKGEPKFKILDEKGRERAANQVVGEEYHEEIPEPIAKPVVKPKPQMRPPMPRINHVIKSKIIDERQLLLDSMGEEGIQKAMALVRGYINSSESRKKKERVKSIQKLMKDKYPLDLATRAIEYAEKAPETQDIIKTNKSKNIIGVIITIIIIIIGSFFFLI